MFCADQVGPSVAAFDAIVSGSLAKFIAASNKIGGDVKTQVNEAMQRLMLFDLEKL